jgi:hypothetical protein
VSRAPQYACGGVTSPCWPDARFVRVTACACDGAHLFPGGRLVTRPAAGGFSGIGCALKVHGLRSGGRGCQCLQRHNHAERTGREPGAKPTVTAGRDQCFGVGSRLAPDPKRRDVTRRRADQSLTAGRDRHLIPSAACTLLPAGFGAAGAANAPAAFLARRGVCPALRDARDCGPRVRATGADLFPVGHLGGWPVPPPSLLEGDACTR